MNERVVGPEGGEKRGPAHRSKLVPAYLASSEPRVWAERLPGYAPELNPIKYLWGYAKGNDLANFAPKELWELIRAARTALTRVGTVTRVLCAFWIHSTLNLDGL